MLSLLTSVFVLTFSVVHRLDLLNIRKTGHDSFYFESLSVKYRSIKMVDRESLTKDTVELYSGKDGIQWFDPY